MKNWKIIRFFILSIIIFTSLSFLWFNKWIWLYSDSGYTPITIERTIQYILPFSWNWNESYLSYDNTLLHSTRYIQDLINILWQNITFFLFFVFCFLFSYKVFRFLYNESWSFLGALIYTFNPISIYFLNLPWFFFSYFSLPLIIYAIYSFIKTKKYIYILLSILWFYFLLSYTRILGIFWLLLVFIGIFFIKDLYWFIKKNIYKTIFFVFMHIIFFLPFLFALLYPSFSGDKLYFQGIWNYASESMELYGNSFYNWLLNTPFYEWFILKEPIKNFSWDFQNNLIYKMISLLFFSIILIYTLLYKRNNDYLITKLWLLLLFTIFIIMWPHFLPLWIFINISYKYFPFISSNTFWLFLIYIPIISLFTAFLLNLFKINSQILSYRFITILSYVFIFFSLWWIILQNDKLNNISIEDIPKAYVNTFYAKEIQKYSYISYPSPKEYPLVFKWSYYPFFIQNNSRYQPLLSDNKRLVNYKQSYLHWNIKKDYNYNLAILNLKNIFVFKDILNPKIGEFEYYEVKDYVWESKMYYYKLINDSNLYVKQDNENFAQFWLNYDDKYEYKIYSPAKIIPSEIDTFFETKIDIYDKPLLVDSKSFQKIENIENFKIPKENQNININVKESVLNPTKHYIKLSNIDTSKPFLLQMNQTFGMSWKIKWVDKSYFNEKPCLDEYTNYSITDNSVCQYKSKLIELEDIRLLGKPEVNNKNHFEWNFVWNTWIINPEDIPNEMKWEKELYAVIIYEKQIYYSYALIISWLTFLILIILTIIQEIKNFFLMRRK